MDELCPAIKHRSKFSILCICFSRRTLHLQVVDDVNEQKLVNQVSLIFKEVGVTNLTVVANGLLSNEIILETLKKKLN